MKNYIGYCRVSTKYQEKSGLGLLAQQDSTIMCENPPTSG